MATQIIKKLLDDLDGGDADDTINFAMDGITYKIDLSHKNASEFRELMAKYQEAAERTGRVGSPPSLRTTSAASYSTATNAANRELNNKIRTWAGANGYELSDRGRIPQYIQDAYHSGTPNPVAALPEPDPEPETPAPKKTVARKRAPAAAFSSTKK